MIRSRSSTRAVATADAIIEYAKTKRKTSLCESQERFPFRYTPEVVPKQRKWAA